MKSLIISKMMLKMWRQEMYKLFDTQTKRIIVVLFFLFAVTMGAIIGYSFTGVFMKAFLNGDERSLGLLVVSMAINASIFTSLLFVLIKVRTPEQDRFSILTQLVSAVYLSKKSWLLHSDGDSRDRACFIFHRDLAFT